MKTIIGLKKNMSQIFKEDGNVVPVTFVDVADIVVAHKKTVEKDGYSATVIGLGKKKNPSKAEVGKFKELGFVPMYAVEVELDEELNIGDKVNVSMFETIKKVNVTGITKGKGFQGVVKRWGFKGGPRTHGQSDRQRHPGSIGMRTTPGRVFKGKKMAGRKKAVCLVSGGMDSFVAAALARKQGYRIFCLSVDYGQKNRRELQSARKIARFLKAERHLTIRADLSWAGSSLVDRRKRIPCP